MSGGGGGDSEGRIRVAQYMENLHRHCIDNDDTHKLWTSVFQAFNVATQSGSPYQGYTPYAYDVGFFGRKEGGANYVLSDYPSLWDMFGAYMSGQDILTLWSAMYERLTAGPEIANAVAAHSALLQDDIDENVIPRFVGGMRDINSVQSTAFIIGKSNIASAHVKSVNKFASELRIEGLRQSVGAWDRMLNWHQAVVSTYMEMYKLYLSAKMDIDGVNMEYAVKDQLWTLSAFDIIRAFLGVFNGAPASTGGLSQPSQAQKAIGGAMSGAAMGYQVSGSGYGAVVGGVLGAASAFL